MSQDQLVSKPTGNFGIEFHIVFENSRKRRTQWNSEWGYARRNKVIRALGMVQVYSAKSAFSE